MDLVLETENVSSYHAANQYKKFDRPVEYSFTIEEETCLKDHVTRHLYTLDLEVLTNHREKGNYNFIVRTTDQQFKLDKQWAKQGKFLADLSELTEEVNLWVDEKGSIASFDHPKLQQKWKNLKLRLLKNHIGEKVENYIREIENRINNKTLFLEDLKQPKLFGLLFDGYGTLQEKRGSRQRKINSLIHGLPICFEEHFVQTKETFPEQEISIQGKMKHLDANALSRIQAYFKFNDIVETAPFLVYYKKNAVLDMDSGYVKKSHFQLELTNGNGYTKKQVLELKQK
ncbi:hypothetical protein [Flagellimonas marinaquae]|uniref:hypothetical protein n=1 Tax=Flagellimonas marinaquae TaxID=254955 RepID=UPI002074D1C6|nr:hypothetical protein [Allomuricauda aquimarina]USD26878.1 hypothetical protein MJO53_08265 [Allomuricauda aquimarina]